MARQSERRLWAARIAGRTTAPARGTAEPASTGLGLRFRGLVLGIDPSLRGSGFAIVEVSGAERMRLLASETLRLPTAISMTACLGRIAETVVRLLQSHAVLHVAVEETIYVQNFRTAQILGAARGAAIGAAAMRGLPIFEYPPLRVKQAVAGFGRASKEQVGRQMIALMDLPETLPLDESDAAAVAACHALTWRAPL
jgi:crossover junction endodeoxyribonuclease RuvC